MTDTDTSSGVPIICAGKVVGVAPVIWKPMFNAPFEADISTPTKKRKILLEVGFHGRELMNFVAKYDDVFDLVAYLRWYRSSNQHSHTVSREAFDRAVEAVWSEIQYQNELPRRTDSGEAHGIAGYASLIDKCNRDMVDTWYAEKGEDRCLHNIRKTAASAIRGMIFCGVRPRVDDLGKAI